jgi:nicotinamidase-related amidase
LIASPIDHGLVIVFTVATALSVVAGVASLLRGGREVPIPITPHPDPGATRMNLDPTRTALLLMDYQNGIVARLGEPAAALLGRAATAVATMRESGAHVAFVRVAFTDEDLAAIPETSMMGRRIASSPAALRADSANTAIHELLTPRGGDVVVRKTRVGAFSTTDLADQLAVRGIDTLLPAGISTSGCVLSTIRDASDRDYRLLVVSDLCADPEPELHAFLIDRILPRQAEMIVADALRTLLAPA